MHPYARNPYFAPEAANYVNYGQRNPAPRRRPRERHGPNSAPMADNMDHVGSQYGGSYMFDDDDVNLSVTGWVYDHEHNLLGTIPSWKLEDAQRIWGDRVWRVWASNMDEHLAELRRGGMDYDFESDRPFYARNPYFAPEAANYVNYGQRNPGPFAWPDGTNPPCSEDEKCRGDLRAVYSGRVFDPDALHPVAREEWERQRRDAYSAGYQNPLPVQRNPIYWAVGRHKGQVVDRDGMSGAELFGLMQEGKIFIRKTPSGRRGKRGSLKARASIGVRRKKTGGTAATPCPGCGVSSRKPLNFHPASCSLKQQR